MATGPAEVAQPGHGMKTDSVTATASDPCESSVPGQFESQFSEGCSM